MKTNTLTRLLVFTGLVLTGIVALATSLGAVTAQAGEAAVAQTDKAPEIIAAEADTSFAPGLPAKSADHPELKAFPAAKDKMDRHGVTCGFNSDQ